MEHKRERIKKALNELSDALTAYGRDVELDVQKIESTQYDDNGRRYFYVVKALLRVEIGDE